MTRGGGEREGTAAWHAAAWDPMNGRVWTSKNMVLDHPRPARLGPSSQRMRDGTLQPERKEPMLTNPPRTDYKMHQHPDKLKDGSPRNALTSACFDLGFERQFATTAATAYEGRQPGARELTQPTAGASSSFAAGVRDTKSLNDGDHNRHAAVALSKLSPRVYEAVFNREKNEPPTSPRHLPLEARTAARGAATVPTAPDWAEGNLLLPSAQLARRLNPPTYSPRVQAADDKFRLALVEAQLRSERRQTAARLALAVDSQRPAGIPPPLQPSPRFSMSPREQHNVVHQQRFL